MSTQEQQYVRGFNHGYLLTKHLPDLVVRLLKGIQNTRNNYFSGFISGKEEYEHEYNQNLLNELDKLRNSTKDQDREIERQ